MPDFMPRKNILNFKNFFEKGIAILLLLWYYYKAYCAIM